MGVHWGIDDIKIAVFKTLRRLDTT